jgi:tryptophan 2,3-dioxygenase
VVAESESWQLTGDERKSLYLSVAQSLDKANDEHAFAILHAYLRLFELDKNNAMPEEKHARHCVILAIKSASVINFEELLSLKTIKALEEKNQDVFKFLSLFTQADTKDFKNQLGSFSALMKAEGLTEEDVIRKKSYVAICSLATENTNFKYSDLAALLNIAAADVEEWAIEAISRNIIDAKID